MNQRSTFDTSRRSERRLPIETVKEWDWQLRILPAVAIGLLFAAAASCFGQQPNQQPLHTPEESQQMVDPEILPLAQLTTNVALPEERDEHGELVPMPADYARSYFAEPPREPLACIAASSWPEEIGYGPALNFAYRPLYFEQVNMERYGRSFGCLVQPCVSTVHFYTSAALLPFKMVVHPPMRRVYYDHHFRPGGPTLDE